MGSTTSPKSAPTSPLFRALDAELLALERGVARTAQALSVIGVALSLYVTWITPLMGRSLAIACVVAFAWFTLLERLLARGVALRLLSILSPLSEATFPGIALIIMARTQGAAYAIASWVPPLLFALLVFLATVRLKPFLPLLLGVVGAAEYGLIYAFVLRKAPLEHLVDQALYRPPMQVTRAVSIVLFGALGALVSTALRRAVGRAASQTRAQELFGKYRIGKPIASGGMGTVFEALYCPEGGFERKVAIKRVHPHLAQDKSFVDSFRAEAELCARLAHPNIVAVFDFGKVEDTYFFAMEHVEGMDLLRLRKRCAAAKRTIPTRLVALIGREICEGLAFAHESALDQAGKPLRVLHRDLNPSNVLLSRSGQVKISDFGIAKALGESARYQTRNIAGKLTYLSPEQARGEPFDLRADLYALGLVVWELLCLRAAFSGGSDPATLLAVIAAETPLPSAERPELRDTPWDAFCQRALAGRPDERFQSAREMGAALTQILSSEGLPQPDELSNFLAEIEALAPEPAADAPTVVEGHASRTLKDL
jgi:serine/threonine-protein kinase